MIHDIFSIMDRNKWIFTESLQEADVIPALFIQDEDYSFVKTILRPDQILLVLNIYHNDNYLDQSFYRDNVYCNHYKSNHERTLIVHTNLLDDGIDPRFLCFDIMFNRTKFFCIDPDRHAYLPNVDDVKVWGRHLAPSGTFEISSIEKKYNQSNRHFLAPNRIRNGEISEQQSLRRRLSELLTKLNSEKIYLSDPAKGIFLKTNGWDADFEKSSRIDGNGGWYPVADDYYNTSYVSVFIESVTSYGIGSVDSSGISPSEKMFDPLIKGNFVLGFSSPYTIKYCKDFYGFKFPDWIDYSYDEIMEHGKRTDAYFDSINQVASIPIQKLHQLYERDKHILEHNQQVFYKRPYDSLYDKVLKSANIMGWR